MNRTEFKPGNMLNPLPVVMVSCQRPGDKPNIITVAWAGTICSDPAMVSVSIRPSRYSHDIVCETKEFVINIPGADQTFATDWCGVKSGKDVDKFKEMKLTPSKSLHVECPGISECPVSIECKVKDILPLGSHDMFIAEVVGVTVDSEYMDENDRFCFDDTNPICYSHGEYRVLGKKLGKFGYSVQKKHTNRRK